MSSIAIEKMFGGSWFGALETTDSEIEWGSHSAATKRKISREALYRRGDAVRDLELYYSALRNSPPPAGSKAVQIARAQKLSYSKNLSVEDVEFLTRSMRSRLERRKEELAVKANLDSLPLGRYVPSKRLVTRFAGNTKGAYPGLLHRLIWMKRLGEDEAAERIHRAYIGALSYFAAKVLPPEHESVRLNDAQLGRLAELVAERLGLAGTVMNGGGLATAVLEDAQRCLLGKRLDLGFAWVTARSGTLYLERKATARRTQTPKDEMADKSSLVA